MKRYSGLQSTTSLFLIICLLIQFSGCVSYKIISNSDLPLSGNYLYRIDGLNSTYTLDNTTISDGVLSGKINMAKSSQITKVVHLYLASDSAMMIDENEILTIPLESIVKIEKADSSPGTAIVISVFAAGGLILLILLATWSFDAPLGNF
jgi:hypothetical protein